MDLNTTPIKIDIEPGDQTSEHARAQMLQYGGTGLFVSVLTLAGTTNIAAPILITALICAALITVLPTLHYITSRRALKCEQCRAEAEVQKQQIAKQAEATKEASGSA